MRRPVVAFLRFTLRIFFRRVASEGVERVPAAGPVLFVLNHPNSLIDPIFLLALAPREVAFLAKAPLFRMPLVGWLVRAAGSIPVERRQDEGADPSRNREMFTRVRSHLAGHGAIALFPEGTSHSDPRLRPMKSGAARIALGVTSDPPLVIQPVGLYYTAKQTFRSAALVYYGDPFPVAPTPLDADGEPPAGAVRALTERIGQALGAVTLQADAFEAHDFVARTERILASERREGDDAPRPGLQEEFALRKRVLAGYDLLRARDPERLEQMRRRVLRYEDKLRGAGLDPWDVPPGGLRPGRVAVATGTFLFRFLLLLPLGVPGLLVHYLPYRLVGLLSQRAVGRYDDVLATAKAVAAFIVFPLAWLLVAWLGFRWGGVVGGGAGLLLAPASGLAALRLSERADRAAGALRALALWLLGRRRFHHLQVERSRLRTDLRALAAELGV